MENKRTFLKHSRPNKWHWIAAAAAGGSDFKVVSGQKEQYHHSSSELASEQRM